MSGFVRVGEAGRGGYGITGMEPGARGSKSSAKIVSACILERVARGPGLEGGRKLALLASRQKGDLIG